MLCSSVLYICTPCCCCCCWGLYLTAATSANCCFQRLWPVLTEGKNPCDHSCGGQQKQITFLAVLPAPDQALQTCWHSLGPPGMPWASPWGCASCPPWHSHYPYLECHCLQHSLTAFTRLRICLKLLDPQRRPGASLGVRQLSTLASTLLLPLP